MAVVTGGAQITVVTRSLVECVDAPHIRLAGIGCADTVVVTIQGTGGNTLTFHAGLPDGAEVAVFASPLLGRENTSGSWIAGVARADIVILANQRAFADAHSSGTRITGGAGIAVITRLGVVHMEATSSRVTRVVRTGITVVAVGRDSRHTNTLSAGIPYGAQIPVFACKTLMIELESALAALWRAGRLQTDRIDPFRLRTNHQRTRHDAAPIWEFRGVALQHTIAYVFVLQRQAILIYLAIARDTHAQTRTVTALVGDGAWVAVIAGTFVVLKETTPKAIAGVICARVVVVADNGIAHALPRFTMVARSTGVTVKTLS